ncbi:histidinol-phosphatase [Rapidithrix thailandica]|uniref:Histidinol-phosphatase n=1 Tax=Rapidithrix thailandica TaxID=413964 RepID=A0AAW9SGQ8_9BACT
MQSWTNYHSHCHYCDGKYAPEIHIKAALQQGVKIYGFSSHSPLFVPTTWNMKMERLKDYLQEINRLKEQYQADIQIYTGMEVDFIPGSTQVDSPYIQEAGLDYTIGSIHFVDSFADGTPWEVDGGHQLFLKGLKDIFDGNVQQAIKRYFERTREMLQTACPDVLGHMDKIKIQCEEGQLFSENEDWYREEVLATLEVAQQSGVIIEVNTRGVYKKKLPDAYPSRWILEEILKLDIPVMLNADSHHPDEITANFSESASMLQDIGFKTFRILHQNKWQDVPFTSEGLFIP